MKMGELKHFHSSVNCSSKMGPCCYWNSISIILQYYKMEQLIIPFLHLSYAYSTRLDNAFITEKETEQNSWTSQYFHINSSQQAHTSSLLAQGYPVSVNIQLYPMSLHLPIYPRVNQLHYLIVTGADEENVNVIDRHFNFAGNIRRELLFDPAPESGLISDTIYWVSPNNLSYKQDMKTKIEPALIKAFLHHINAYLGGRAVWNNIEYQTGLRALQSLHDDLPTILEYYFDSYHYQYALDHFLHRLNNSFTDQREGLLTCIPFFDGKIADTLRNRLVYNLNCSLRELKKLNYIAMLGKQSAESLSEISRKMKRKIKEVQELEATVEYELYTITQALGGN